jgi:hypothetical protein
MSNRKQEKRREKGCHAIDFLMHGRTRPIPLKFELFRGVRLIPPLRFGFF